MLEHWLIELIGQQNGDKRAESRLHPREKEIDPVEATETRAGR